MKDYLIKNKIKNNLIETIKSKPNTFGNILIIKEYMMKNKNYDYFLLTNFYHLPRVMDMLFRIFDKISIKPLCAEAILFTKKRKKIIKKYKTLLMDNRIISEINGLSDLLNNNYRS